VVDWNARQRARIHLRGRLEWRPSIPLTGVGVLKRSLTILAAVSATTGTSGVAKSPFIGQWKLDASKSRMPDEMKVERRGDNRYAFDFGGGPETILADGTDQPGLGATLLSVKSAAPDIWVVTRKKGSRLLLSATWKLSEDDGTLTDDYREFESDGSTLTMEYVYRRAGRGSGIAADWRSIKETITSPFSMEVRAFQGDGLSFIIPSEGKTKNVRFDGRDYPNEGANAGRGAFSSIRRLDEHTLVITDKQNGKVVDTQELRLSRDQTTLTMTVHYVGRDKPNVLVFART